MAMNPNWCQPLGAWQDKFSEWIHTAEPKALLQASVFFDFRGAYGENPGPGAHIQESIPFFKVLTNQSQAQYGCRVPSGAKSHARVDLHHEILRGWCVSDAHSGGALYVGGNRLPRDAVQLLQDGLPVTVGRADVRAWARDRGLGIEEAARQARYTFLLRVVEEAERLHGWIEQACAAGGRLLCGGGRNGAMLEATLGLSTRWLRSAVNNA